jgi:TetR/AcrR family transcriptional repressor of nem operon
MAARDPQATRNQILRSAFRAVYEQGMSATSLDEVLARAGVTKGALYHHFDGKKGLGCALVADVLAPLIAAEWIEPLRATTDPIAVLQEMLGRQAAAPREDTVRFGCPLNNLAQEVSTLDEDLRARVQEVFAQWVGALRDALARGQGAGTVRADADPERVARFVVGAVEGAISLAKVSRDAAVLRGSLAELTAYLEALRPARRAARKR